MSKTTILSKMLTDQEKKMLRKKKIKLADLFSKEEAELLNLLEGDEDRIQKIFAIFSTVEKKPKSQISASYNDDIIYANPLNTSMEHLGVGLVTALSRSIGAYKEFNSLDLTAQYNSASIIGNFSGLSQTTSALQLTIDSATKINGLVNPSAGMGQMLSAVTVGADLAKLSITIPGQTSPSSLYGKADYLALNTVHKHDSVSGIFQSLTGLGTSLNAAVQVINPITILNHNGLKDSISASIWGQNTTNFITANPSQTSGMLTGLSGGLNLAISGAVKGSWLEQPEYQSLSISALSNGLSAHFKSSEIFGQGIGMAMSSVSVLGTLAEQSLSAVKWANLGKITNLSAEVISATKNDFTQFASNYSNVLHSIDKKPNWIYEAPNLITLSPNVFYTQSRMVEMLSVEDVGAFETNDTDLALEELNEVSLRHLLHQLNPDMIKMWDGAIEALHGSNPDFLRHFTLSIRELYTQLTHALSPDKEFIKWDVNGEHLHQGKPTRQGRLYYINRNLHGSKKEFSKFLNVEVKNTLDLVDILNSGTHGINSSLTRPQLKTIKIKAEQLFVSLLQIEFSINRVN